MGQRRKFEPGFKAKVVLELLRGDKTPAPTGVNPMEHGWQHRRTQS